LSLPRGGEPGKLGRVGLAGLCAGWSDPLGEAAFAGGAELGEAREERGWSLILMATEVRGWLATLGRLILWVLQFLPLVSVPEAHQEVSLTS
jgi:hypothetical protein